MSLAPANTAFTLWRRHPLRLMLTWCVSSLPPLAAAALLVSVALRGGATTQASDLLSLLSCASLLVGTALWHAMGTAFLVRQASALLDGRTPPALPNPRLLANRLPAVVAAQGARLGITLVATLPLGAGLPLARVLTAMWSIRAALGLPREPPACQPSAWGSIGAICAISWLLTLALTANGVLAAIWTSRGALPESSAQLPELGNPWLWASFLFLALAVSEPWKVLALVAVLKPGDGRPLSQQEPPS